MRSFGFLWVLALLIIHGTLFAGFQFSHQTSAMSIRSAKLILGTPLIDWDGTLQQHGTITGQPITFADGILTNNTTSALFNGVYHGSLNPITLDVNRTLVVNCGSFSPQITVIRGGNVLQGQPLFINNSSINLTHQLSSLTIGVQTALNSNIVLNQGKVTLSDHLFMGDDRTITGSGTMALDRRRFAFGGKDLHLTHTILWSDANDVVLNSRIQLSGIWTFTGVTARLNGNGNVLDLSVGGTILIKSGTTLHVSDIKIRGLGIGQIIFEDKNSSLHITSAELEVVSNLTFTVGGIYAESCSRIITGNKILTFSEQATLSVDQITLYYDTLTFNDTNNIQPLIGAANNPGGKNVASVNNGTIGHLDSGLSTKVRTNSNALLRLTTNNSQALLSCCKNSSNSIINLNSLIRVNSNASLALNKNSSHTLLRLTRNNSQAILNLDNQIRVSSNALLALNKNSSNAILNLNNNIQTANTNIRVNSNAFVSLTTNNSNALLKLFANNSNAILSNEACCRVNSNALLTLATNNSNTLLRLTTNNSQALLYLAKNNSNTILNGDLNQLRYTSNALLACCKNTSNSIVNLDSLIRVNSNASLAMNKNNSNSLLALNRNSSNAILNLNNNIQTSNTNIRVNSNAFVSLTTNNSNALLKLFANNSNAILSNASCCRANSNALLALNKNNSNTLLRLTTNNSEAILNLNNQIRLNSNALLTLATNNSNTLLRLTTNNSQALLYLVKNNSNTILNGDLNQLRYTSNALLACCKNSSNSIINLNSLIRVNSNASLSLSKDNSNAFVSLTTNNSNALLKLFANNSNAILSNASCCRANSNALLALNKNNSNTLLRLTTNNSEAILNLNNQIRVNSNALLTLATNNSNTLLRLTTNNSQALLYLAKNNSNTILNGDLNQLRYTSNALLACCKNTSNSIVNLDSLIRVNSNASLAMNKNNSNSLLALNRNSSNAILNLNNNIQTANTNIRVNSNAFVSLTTNNSNALLKLFANNSNAILSNASCCRVNSNALLALNKNNSNTLLRLTTNNSEAILNLNNQIRLNSNALLTLAKNNSNTLLRLTTNNSQALLYLAKNNSNTILNGDLNQLRYTSNALLACCKNSSNSIMNLNNLIRVNSNTLLSLTTNNSNALLRLTANNSQTLVACCKNNSNALISFGRNNSNAIAKLKSQVNCCSLVQAPVAADVLMECNCIVDPVKVINVVNTLTIDGQGAWIEFCSPITPQFILADGVTVTLQNVTLTRINANTFSLGAGATIVLGENVTFELEDDLTLNGQAFAVGGTIDNPFVWTIRGLGGKRRLTLAPNVAVGQYISLGFNTLLLQNIDLAGVENISITRGVNLSGALVTGALGFGGEAEISLGQDTDTTFVVEGNDNRITMLDTGLALTGFILYSDIFDSELHLSFHVQAPIVGNPSVSFGPDLLFLNSAIGRASIIFDDAWAIVVNQNGNSFVTDAHAFIGGRNVEVNGFPIKQTSAGLVLDSGLNLYSDQPNAIDRSSIRGLQFRSQPRTHVITALDIKRMKEYEQLQDTIEVSSRPQKPKASSNRERQKQNKYGRRNSFLNNEIFEKGIEKNVLRRSFVSTASAQFQILKNYFQEQIKKYTTLKRLFVLPNIFQLEQNGSAVKVEHASDNILIHSGGIGLDFGIDPVKQLSLYLGNNVSGNGAIRQGFKDATLKPNDKIFVRSLNNRIQIQEHFTIQGEIVMTPGSELIFEFLDNGKDPVLFFDTTYNSFFDIAHDAQVRFTGRGKVVFGDGFIMRLEGGKLTPEKTRLLFDEGVFVVLDDEGESTVIIDGDGKLLFDRGAQLNIQAGQHLVIGRLDEPTLPPDGIDITLDRGAEWNLNEDVDGDNIQEGDARISVIGSSNFSLHVHDEAKIYIGSQGVLEINALFNERLEFPGILTNLAFTSKGTLSFENSGEFVLGLNKNFVTTSVDTKKGILQTDGTGIAQFAARNDSVTVRLGNSSVVNQGNAFKGLIQDSGQFIGLKGSCAGRDIIRRLINIVPSLSFSTFFKRGDFSQGIELLGGGGSIQSPMLILELDKNDDVRSDDVIANIVVGFNGSSLLTIDRLGNRQLH